MPEPIVASFPERFPLLFNIRWVANNLAKEIASVDLERLCGEYRSLRDCAPSRHEQGKSYFVGHDGVPSTTGTADRRDEQSAIALWNLNLDWEHPSGGRFSYLDYQFPLASRKSDTGIGKIDLVGVNDRGRLILSVLYVGGNSTDLGDAPPLVLMKGLRYAAIVEANLGAIAKEAKIQFDVELQRTPPIIQILGTQDWWRGWMNSASVGDWWSEFVTLRDRIQNEISVSIEFFACRRLDDTSSVDDEKPQLLPMPIPSEDFMSDESERPVPGVDFVVPLDEFERLDINTSLVGYNCVETDTISMRLKEQKYQKPAEVSDALQVLWSLASFYFGHDYERKDPFKPMLQGADGRRSLKPKDFMAEQITVIEKFAPKVENPGLRARLADVVWFIRPRSIYMASVAIDAYCESVEQVEKGEAVFFDISVGGGMIPDSELWGEDARKTMERAGQIYYATKNEIRRSPRRFRELLIRLLEMAYSGENGDGFCLMAEISLRYSIMPVEQLATLAKNLAGKPNIVPDLQANLLVLADEADKHSQYARDENRQARIRFFREWFHEHSEDAANRRSHDGDDVYDVLGKNFLVESGNDVYEVLRNNFPVESEEIIDDAVHEIASGGDTKKSNLNNREGNESDDGKLIQWDEANNIAAEFNLLRTELLKTPTDTEFTIGDDGLIHLAGPSNLEPNRQASDLLLELKAAVNDLSEALAGTNVYLALSKKVELYKEAVAGEEISIELLFGRGVKLANVAYATGKSIESGEIPPLTLEIESSLNSVLTLHQSFMMTSEKGRFLVETSLNYRQSPENKGLQMAAAMEFARSIEKNQNLFGDDVRERAVENALEIGSGPYPEKSIQVYVGETKRQAYLIAAATMLAPNLDSIFFTVFGNVPVAMGAGLRLGHEALLFLTANASLLLDLAAFTQSDLTWMRSLLSLVDRIKDFLKTRP